MRLGSCSNVYIGSPHEIYIYSVFSLPGYHNIETFHFNKQEKEITSHNTVVGYCNHAPR